MHLEKRKNLMDLLPPYAINGQVRSEPERIQDITGSP